MSNVANSSLNSFRRRAGISSGPDALWTCKFCNKVRTPRVSMLNVVMSGKGGSFNGGKVAAVDDVKTEVKYLLSNWALVRLSL